MENEINQEEDLEQDVSTKLNKKKIFSLFFVLFLVVFFVISFLFFEKDKISNNVDDNALMEETKNEEYIYNGPKLDHIYVKDILMKHEKEVKDVMSNLNKPTGSQESKNIRDYRDGVIDEDEFNRRRKEINDIQDQYYDEVLDLFTQQGRKDMTESELLKQTMVFFDLSQVKEGFYTDIIKEVEEYTPKKEMSEDLLEDIKSMIEVYFPTEKECRIRIKKENEDDISELFNEYDFSYSANLRDCKNPHIFVDPELDIKPVYPYLISDDNRIRIPWHEEFIPYDLMYEDGDWKIDTTVSMKHINYIYNGVEKLENIDNISGGHFRYFRFLEMVKELEDYKNDNGYYPSSLTDLFPLYSIGIYENANLDETSLKYAISRDSNPDKVHLSMLFAPLSESESNDDIFNLDSDFNSTDIFINGFSGSDEKVKFDDSGKYVGVRFDLKSDDFNRAIGYFDELFEKSEKVAKEKKELYEIDKKVSLDVKHLQTALEMYYTEMGTYPSSNSYDNGILLLNKGFLKEVPVNPHEDDTFYGYISSGDLSWYEIEYELFSGTNNLETGKLIACPSGRYCDKKIELKEQKSFEIDSDGDGLSEEDES